MIFSGKDFSEQIVKDLEVKFRNLSHPASLAVLVDSRNEGAVKYTALKRKMASRLGVEFKEVNNLDEANFADGIIIQLPYPNSSELISHIPLEKDVDGLREESLYKPAVVRAVLEILAVNNFLNLSTIIIGNEGFVGKRLQKELHCDGMDKDDFDPTSPRLRGASVIISCTGQAGLIKPEMVKDGVVAIDVGYPKGDFDPQVAEKASFFTPVPGGVGPVTVVMLFKNLVDK